MDEEFKRQQKRNKSLRKGTQFLNKEHKNSFHINLIARKISIEVARLVQRNQMSTGKDYMQLIPSAVQEVIRRQELQ